MAKDPAVLFYTSDFLSGTFTMTLEEKGAYITLLCLQHQKEKLTEKDLQIYKDYPDVLCKFQLLEDGFYYNLKMKELAEKRKNFSKSRSDNRKGKTKDMNNISSSYDNHIKNISTSYVKHMENENENEDLIKDLNEDLNTNTTNTGNLKNIVEKILDVLVDYDSDIKEYNMAIDDFNELGGIEGISEILEWDSTQKSNWNRKIQNVYEVK